MKQAKQNKTTKKTKTNKPVLEFYFTSYYIKGSQGAGQMAQHLAALVVLPEDRVQFPASM